MTLAQRIKLNKVQNLATYDKKPPKRVMIEVKKSPKKATPKQYGDKGYKPSTGKGVGY